MRTSTMRVRLTRTLLSAILVLPLIGVGDGAFAGTTAPSPTPAVEPIEPAALLSPNLMPSTKSLMATIRDLVAMAPRATGTPGGKAAAYYVARRFKAAGLKDVHFETAKTFSWKASGVSLKVDGKNYSTTAIEHSFIKSSTEPSHRTLGSKGKTAQVIDIGSASKAPASVKGKIVMFDLNFELPLAAIGVLTEFLWDPMLQIIDPQTLLTANPYQTSLKTTMKSIMDQGAVGAIGVLSDYFDSNKYHNEYYRQIAMTVPGFWITKKAGAEIRSKFGAKTTATMKLTADRKEAVARTVVGFLPGRSTDSILVQSHHDSQGPGATEDGSGTASVIGLADYYGALARQPGAKTRAKTLMFATFDTHFTGYQQHRAFVEKYLLKKETKYRIVADAAIEHIAKQAKIGKDGKLNVLNQPEPTGIFENVNPLLKATIIGAVVKNDLRATAVLNAAPLQPVGIPTDASFALLAGIPVVSLIAGPAYMYDEADTIDKVDAERMRPMTTAYAQIINAIDGTPSDLIGLLPAPISDGLAQIELALGLLG